MRTSLALAAALSVLPYFVRAQSSARASASRDTLPPFAGTPAPRDTDALVAAADDARHGRFGLAAPMMATRSHRDAISALRTDSVAWQRVMVYVVQALAPTLVHAAADSAPQPWEIHLPPAEPQRRLLETQLRTALRARPIRSTDSVTHRLVIGVLRIVNDTAMVGVAMNETRRCPGTTRTTGFGWLDTVHVARDPNWGVWGAAFSRRVLVGDRVSC